LIVLSVHWLSHEYKKICFFDNFFELFQAKSKTY
jgi:hypothetical protein